MENELAPDIFRSLPFRFDIPPGSSADWELQNRLAVKGPDFELTLFFRPWHVNQPPPWNKIVGREELSTPSGPTELIISEQRVPVEEIPVAALLGVAVASLQAFTSNSSVPGIVASVVAIGLVIASFRPRGVLAIAAAGGTGFGLLLSYLSPWQWPPPALAGLVALLLAVLLPHRRMSLSLTYAFLYDGILYIFVTRVGRARRRRAPVDSVVRSVRFP